MINHFFEVYKYFKWSSSMFSCPSFYQYFNSALYSHVFGEEFNYYHVVNIVIGVVALVVLYYVISLVYKLVKAIINVVYGIKYMIVIIYKFIRGIKNFIFSGRSSSTTTSKNGDGNGNRNENENKNESQNSAKELDPVRENKSAAQYNAFSAPTVVSSQSNRVPNYRQQQQQFTATHPCSSINHQQCEASFSSTNVGGIYNHNNDITSGFVHDRSSFPIPTGDQFQQQPTMMTAQQQQYFFLQQQQQQTAANVVVPVSSVNAYNYDSEEDIDNDWNEEVYNKQMKAAAANFVVPVSYGNADNYDSEEDIDNDWNEENYNKQMKATNLSTTAKKKPTATISATVAAAKPKKTATPRETEKATIASSSTKKRSRMSENNADLGNKNSATPSSSTRPSKKQRKLDGRARAKKWAEKLEKPTPKK